MKKRLFTFLCVFVLLLALGAAAHADGGVAIDAAHFPDEAFRRYVSETWDADNNGSLDADEIAAARSIWLSANAASIQYHGLTQEQVNYIQANWQENIASLEGIEYFTNLRYLYAFMMTKLTGTVDLRQNTELRSIDMHNIEWINGKSVIKSPVTEVKVSGLQKLREINLTNHYAVKSIDVSGCPALEKLSVTGTGVSTVDVSRNKNLKSLSCGFNPHISKLDVSQNEAIEVLNVNGISSPFELTLGSQQNLRVLSAQDSSIETLDISGCPILLAQLKAEYYHDEGESHRYESVPGDDGYHLWYSKMTTLITDGSVAIDAAHFPDEAFREYVSVTFDGNGDGVLSTDEIARAEHVMLSYDHSWVENGSITQAEFEYVTTHFQNRVASLEGVQYLTHLRWLSAINVTLLTGDLDLSHNTMLETVNVSTSRPNESLTGLTLGNLPYLNTINVNYHDSLGSLDVSGCPALERLSAYSAGLRELDVSKNPQLRGLFINDNHLSSLDLSHNPLLENLACVFNPELTALDVSHNPHLVCLWLALDSGLRELTLGNLPALRILTVNSTALTELNISGCPILLNLLDHPEYYKNRDEENRYLYETGTTNDDQRLTYNKSTTLITDGSVAIDAAHFPDEAFREYVSVFWDKDKNDVLDADEIAAVTNITVSVGQHIFGSITQEESELIYAYGWRNRIKSLEGIRYFTRLKVLNAAGMAQMNDVLDLSHNTALEQVDLVSSGLSGLVLGKLPKLNWLGCAGNSLGTIDLSGCTALTGLNVTNIGLDELDVTMLPLLHDLWCGNNNLTNLNLSNNTRLVKLGCANNQLTQLNLTPCTALETLDCGGNAALTILNVTGLSALTGLDVSTCPALETLSAARTALQELDVSKNSMLQTLILNDNYLSSLDVSHNPLLENLACVNNHRLTKLDVSHNPNLVCLWLAVNPSLSELTLGNHQQLRILTVQETGLPSVNISGCPILLNLLDHPEYYKDMDTRHLYETGDTNDDERLTYNKTTVLISSANGTVSVLSLPTSLTRIEEEAFAGIAADVVVLPDGCAFIGSRAFADCPRLQLVRNAGANTVIAEDAFAGCGNVYVQRNAG